MKLVKFLNNLLSIFTTIAFISLFFTKTFIGQIILGVSGFVMLLVGNLIFIIKKDGQIRDIIAMNVVFLLLNSMIISNIYFKRDDITLSLIIILFISVFGFCIAEIIKKRGK